MISLLNEVSLLEENKSKHKFIETNPKLNPNDLKKEKIETINKKITIESEMFFASLTASILFLFLDKNDMPMVALHWEKYFQHICEKYNSIYKVQMPKVTPHVCRHTFCSNMAKAGMNPKTLQYIMGHSDIGVTLNTYTHVSFEDAEQEMKKINISN